MMNHAEGYDFEGEVERKAIDAFFLATDRYMRGEISLATCRACIQTINDATRGLAGEKLPELTDDLLTNLPREPDQRVAVFKKGDRLFMLSFDYQKEVMISRSYTLANPGSEQMVSFADKASDPVKLGNERFEEICENALKRGYQRL